MSSEVMSSEVGGTKDKVVSKALLDILIFLFLPKAFYLLGIMSS